MERTSAELKRLAREKLAGHWGLVIGAILLQALIVVAILLPFEFLFIFSGGGMVQFVAYLVAEMILGIISTIMQCGITRMMLCFARGQQAGIGMMFGEFTKRPDRYIVGTLLMFGIEMACLLPGSLCWLVGGLQGRMLANVIGAALYLAGAVVMVVIFLRYGLVFFLLVDDPQMGALEAFRESARLMDGRKGRLFYIGLSFIGMYLLGVCSCGLGMLWVTPYTEQTLVSFYLDTIGELDRMQKETYAGEGMPF